MALSGHPDRIAVTCADHHLSFADVDRLSRGVAARLVETSARAVLHVGPSSPALPVALFAAARAGVPFVPLNYRVSAEQLDVLVADHPGSLLVHDGTVPTTAMGSAVHRDDLGSWAGDPDRAPEAPADEDVIAVLLYTSGTTAAPKAAVLRHRHLMAYLFGTIEFGAAAEDEAALV